MTTKHLTRGLLGWHTTAESPACVNSALSNMKEALHTSLPFNEIYNKSTACASTGDVCSFEDSGIIAIVGNPVWNDARLNEISKSHGAASALLDAYQVHGPQFLSDMKGSYAFIISDPDNNQCMAGVDRLGRYPLYYTNTDFGIIFGTSPSVLHAHPDVNHHLCNQGTYNYVYFHMVPSPSSIYRNINKLPAGYILDAKKNKITTTNYWKPNFKRTSSSDFCSLGIELKHLLKQAVDKRTDSSLHIGAFLSGGLDSSTVVGMLSEVSEKQAEAFSIGFSAEGYDEMAYARLTAQHFGVKLHEYYVTPDDVVDALPKVATSYDEPFGNSSALPAYFCAKFAKENGIECLLAGDGGDEIFAGNERYAKQTIFEGYKHIPNWIRRGILETTLMAFPDTPSLLGKAKSYVNQANIQLPDRLQTYNFLHRHDPSEIFTTEFLADINSEIPLEYQRTIYNSPDDASTLDRMLYLDWQYTLADNDLRKVSHMCAIAGVDVVYPMLDDDLIEFSCRLPDKWKLKRQQLRYFYKESLRDWLPEETINKKKQGFGLPFGVWMRTHKDLQELAYDNLEKLKLRGYFNSKFIDHVVTLHRHGHAAYYGELVWILTILELWLSEHGD